MKLILDIQGFRVNKNKFIVKELASYDGHKICHFIFKPPFPLKDMEPNLHKEAIWLMNNYHCIDWHSGHVPYFRCAEIIRELCSKVKYVYVKGLQKADFIRKYTPDSVTVIEMDGQPCIRPMEPRCFYHLKSPCVCALSNVFFLYDHIYT